VELVDTLVLEASVERHESSSLSWGTKQITKGNKMAKTNANFNLSRVTKYKLAGYTDPAARNLYKKMMVDAEAALVAAKNRKFSDPAQTQKGPKNSNE
jgi:hypothetical protein